MKKQFIDLFSFPYLRNTLIAFLALATIIPLYEQLRAFPLFCDQLTNAAEDQAIRIATHLSSYNSFRSSELDSAEAISDSWKQEVFMVSNDLNLEKVKVFSKTGEVIFSTNSDDVGVINQHDYFHDIVVTGQVFTLVVDKDSKSMEGRTLRKSVVETYVPVLRNGIFVGSFEIYYDISSQRNAMNTLLKRFNIDIIIMAVGLSFLAIVLVSQVASEMRGRELAQKAMQASEKRLRAIMASSLDAIITINDDGGIIDFNPAAEQLFGFSTEEVVGQDIAEKIIPLQLRDKHRQGLARYLSSGSQQILCQRLELPAVKSDGVSIDTEIVITPISTGGNTIFTAFIRDITERKQMVASMAEAFQSMEEANLKLNAEMVERRHAEVALAASERRYRSILETTSEGFWLFSSDDFNILEIGNF